MKNRSALALIVGCAAVPAFSFAADAPAPTPLPKYVPDVTFPSQPTPLALSPEDELKTFQLPRGYHLELVLSDPLIREPVLCTFDGNGRMYVAEMRTYMQNADAGNELTPDSRVSRHESTARNGVYDRHTVFLDHVLLPRMLLPLDRGEVMVGLTNTFDIDTYTDAHDSGVSDGRRKFYEGGRNGANLEHQPSGLLWSMDNWIYTTYANYRLRRTPTGTAIKERTAPNGGQWGLAQDDNGKLWWSNAGAEKGLFHFQTHVLYGAIDAEGQFDRGFMEVWPSTGLADFQGGPPRSRPDRTLNHFTGCGGQEVFRGDRLPADLRGNVLLPEPVGRLIRRAEVLDKDGMTTISNPYQAEHSEFIRSTDPYFRPVYTTTGPDGCLYIVDMYRGIIQEGDWTKPGVYLRKVVDQYGLAQTVGRGRVWRLVHDDFKPGPPPHMLDETAGQLVAHLGHPNGWWRDQAQKLLVLRQDLSVVPALREMARTDANPLARMHALWALEGLNAADPSLIREKLQDQDPHVRVAAIRVSESLFKQGDASLKPAVQALAKDPDPFVALQTVETAKAMQWPSWQPATLALLASNHAVGVQEVGKQLLYEPRTFDGAVFAADQVKLLEKGRVIYQQLCFACHGVDGQGMPMEGLPAGTTLAPRLAGSKTVLAPSAGIVSILLHGAAGPIDGKAYDTIMPPQADNDDEWIAAVASYVRNSFGNNASIVTPPEVAAIRRETGRRELPWTLEELKTVVPQPIPNREQWKVSASEGAETSTLAVDGRNDTRYTTGVAQHPGEWYQVEFPQETVIAGLTMDCGNGTDYPRGYKVETSPDGTRWGEPVAVGRGTGTITQISFPPISAKFVRVTQTAGAKVNFWSITELQLLKPPKTGELTAGSPDVHL